MKHSTLWHVVRIAALVSAVSLIAGCAPTAAPTQSPPTVTPATATPEAAVTAQAAGETVAGHWEGAIDVGGQTIAMRADFKESGSDLTGAIDFPTQNALGLQLEAVSRQGDKLHFEVLPKPRTAIFDGALMSADEISGTFEQAGYKGTFQLRRTVVAGGSAEALPYKAEEVTFTNGSITLAGTLTLPEGVGPHPAVVLISGSGAQNRDAELFGFKVFSILADDLTRKGIAVLRYDDRGIGGSSAGTEADTSETFAGDVLAAVQFLKERAEIDGKAIGLLGHSEGGIIAPLVAVQSPDVAFIVLMAGPGLPGKVVLAEQSRLILKASGADEATIAAQGALEDRVIQAAITGEGWDELRAELTQQFKDSIAALPEEQRKTIPDVDEAVAQMVETQIAQMTSPWMKFFLTHDPAPVLEKVTAPVLALFGEKDTQVPAEANRAAVAGALAKGGNKDHTEKLFPGANHLFQAAQTGSPDEYATLKTEFTAGFLTTIEEWILARGPASGK